ncbi:hypothetical protein [Effusibacillus lacus]|uniref:Uncharacterized protein n=1 Tax=Effusibacillus lacus TaxID=1348429 RepID=A0A292YPC2_9BACL|nr:hypothetical protein [Effusibacillus lacus]TCS71118.1 poly(hydroxyalkanoate) inclusion protein PhaP [Effusibacillus lacus]GAX90761.1 hypothetical protein EFBL_2402 [Effusibacillus lacus]
MTLNQNEFNEANDKKYQVDSFVDAVWENYEANVTRARKQLEETEEACLNVWTEVRESMKKQRGNFEGFWKELADKSSGLSNGQSEEWKNVAGKMTELAFTPLKFAMDFMDQVEQRWEDNTREFVKIQRERRNAWVELADQYAAQARSNSRTFWRGFEDRLRPFTGDAN